MAWAAVLSFLLAVLLGRDVNFSLERGYLVSLAYLAVFGSAIAFGCYLALMRRIVDGFGDAFAALGWQCADREGDDVRLRRAALLALVGEVAESEPVLQAAMERCSAYLVAALIILPLLICSGLILLKSLFFATFLFTSFLHFMYNFSNFS